MIRAVACVGGGIGVRRGWGFKPFKPPPKLCPRIFFEVIYGKKEEKGE
jgi:hypothetical protein